MSLGVRGSNPIWLLADLQGNLFDDTFWMFVLENTLPYIPATVYHDPDLNTPWTNPIQFLGNGTLPNDIYFESGKVYRLEFRQHIGPGVATQSDPLIYEVNNYIAGTGGSTPVDTIAFSSSNQITNPQFALISFSSPLSVSATNPAPIEIGPGWFLELFGTGTATISQVPLNNSSENPSNAPYALRINMNGWDAGGVYLRQRFQQNGMLWASQYVSTAVTARVQGSPQSISASLIYSNGLPVSIMDPVNINSEFNEYKGYNELPAPTNADVPPDAYIEYRLALPNNVDIYVTSIQVVVQDEPVTPSFEQDSIERQIDHTFHYYKPKLEYKPIPSYLVGWDFPYNPSQFFANGATTVSAPGANKSAYVWDQTIIFKTIAGAVSTARNSANRGLNVTVSADSSFALIQYIPLETAREILDQSNAIQLQAQLSAGTLSGTVSLWWTDDVTLPDIKSSNYNSLVSAITAGVPTCANGTWHQVRNRLNDIGAVVTSKSSMPFQLTTSDLTISFPGFYEDTTGAADAKWMAIVIAFDTMPSATNMTIEYCSLVAGDIATRPAPQTSDEVLRECQRYYRKSFLTNTTPAENATLASGPTFGVQASINGATNFGPFVRFDYPMIAAPAIILYNPAAANAEIRNISTGTDYTGSGVGTNFTATGFAAGGTTPNPSAAGGLIAVNWTADARLGTY